MRRYGIKLERELEQAIGLELQKKKKKLHVRKPLVVFIYRSEELRLYNPA
jgi:hypothetical protein